MARQPILEWDKLTIATNKDVTHLFLFVILKITLQWNVNKMSAIYALN